MRKIKMVEANSRRCLLEEVWAAERFTHRLLGLMGRRSLEPGRGLYLPGCTSIHMFFMRFPIDVIYLDSHRRVRKIVRGLKPWRTSACIHADSVVEAAAGWVEAAGLTEGMEVSFEEFREARR
jgi:hypothetical protein